MNIQIDWPNFFTLDGEQFPIPEYVKVAPVAELPVEERDSILINAILEEANGRSL
jgi:hypothetical protein